MSHYILLKEDWRIEYRFTKVEHFNEDIRVQEGWVSKMNYIVIDGSRITISL